MGAIDDTRKLLQDLITPDLKAVEARVVALEQKMDLKFDHLEKKFELKFAAVDTRFDSLEKKIDLKFENLAATMVVNQATLMRYLDIDRRLEQLESDKSKALDRPS